MRPLYTAFYTRGTLYEREAARLAASLDALGLPHDVRAVDSLGDWEANTQLTCEHVLAMMAAYPDRPIVQLDADAVVCRRPDLFEDGIDCDLAGHFKGGRELLNGTLYVAPTAAARRVIEMYRDGVHANRGHRNEQWWLQVAVETLAPGHIRLARLPAAYAYIPDLMCGDLAEGESPVVRHHQASRERCPGCGPQVERQKWLREWDKETDA